MKDLGFKIVDLRLDYGHRECSNAKYKICDILNDIAGELRDLREQNAALVKRLENAELRDKALFNEVATIYRIMDDNKK